MLRELYTEMLPLVNPMMAMGRAVGGLGALVFISMQIYGSIARAEPVDFFPLLRPFAVGLAILFFPVVLDVLNGVMGGLSKGTEGMSLNEKREALRLQDEVDTKRAQRPENADFATDEAFEKKLGEIGALDVGDRAGLYMNKVKYDITNSFREGFRNFLQLMYDAAGLVIDVLMTLYLVVLSILGPLAFGFAIWPGFEGSLTNWLSRYINASLWLPVANIVTAMLAHVQVMMLRMDLASLNANQQTPLSDYGYMLFLVLGIAGYAAVPFVASWIVSASGMTEARKSVASAASGGAAIAGAVTGRAFGAADSATSASDSSSSGYRNTQTS
jgi:conjugative transposon TraJ protein